MASIGSCRRSTIPQRSIVGSHHHCDGEWQQRRGFSATLSIHGREQSNMSQCWPTLLGSRLSGATAWKRSSIISVSLCGSFLNSGRGSRSSAPCCSCSGIATRPRPFRRVALRLDDDKPRARRKRAQNRLIRYGWGSRNGLSSLSSSATSLPVAGAIESPSMLWPAAITTFSIAGLRSMIGRLS